MQEHPPIDFSGDQFGDFPAEPLLEAKAVPLYSSNSAKPVKSVTLPLTDGSFVTASDSLALEFPLPLDVQDKIFKLLEKNPQMKGVNATLSQHDEQLFALSIPKGTMLLNPWSHLKDEIDIILQWLKVRTQCFIDSKNPSTYVMNYYAYRGEKALTQDTPSAIFLLNDSRLFTKKHNTKSTAHIDYPKEADKFNFTLTIFACNHSFRPENGKRMFFPAHNLAKEEKSPDPKKDIYVDIVHNKPIMCVFPSYALHATETWNLKLQHNSAKKIQSAWHKFKDKKKPPAPITAEKKSNQEAIKTAACELLAKPPAELEAALETAAGNIAAKQITAKFTAKKKDPKNFDTLKTQLWKQQTKMALCNEMLSQHKAVEEKSAEAKNAKDKKNSLTALHKDQDEKLNYMIEWHFPLRISVVWRGFAEKSGLNCQQLHELVMGTLQNDLFEKPAPTLGNATADGAVLCQRVVG